MDADTGKLSCMSGSEWVDHVHDPVFSFAPGDGPPHLIAGVTGSVALHLLRQLVLAARPPFFLLYVLHTPRGEGEPGRYQSPKITRGDADAFLARFGAFLAQDGRHDLWLHSPADRMTAVWDRHNLLHVRGDTEWAASFLRSLGFREGEAQIPAPHSHNYHARFDDDAAGVLEFFDWSYGELRPQDKQ